MPIKIIIAVPTFENISPDTFKSIYDLDIPDDVVCDFKYIRGYDCAKARNIIAKVGIKEKYDYVFMVDSDIILPKNALIVLLNANANIVFGYYSSKRNRSKSEVFTYNSDKDSGYESYLETSKLEINTLVNSKDEYINIKGNGFGCALIKTQVFTVMGYPYFKYVTYDNGSFLGEDLYFCSKARRNGYTLKLATKVKCGHIHRKIL